MPTVDHRQTSAEMRIFFCACQNWRDGFFLMGDTYQATADGVNFRFCDLQTASCHAYQEDAAGAHMTGSGAAAGAGAPSIQLTTKRRGVPRGFHRGPDLLLLAFVLMKGQTCSLAVGG